MERFFAMLLCMTLLLTGVAVAEGEFPELNEAGFFDGGRVCLYGPGKRCVALLQRYAENRNLSPYARILPRRSGMKRRYGAQRTTLLP